MASETVHRTCPLCEAHCGIAVEVDSQRLLRLLRIALLIVGWRLLVCRLTWRFAGDRNERLRSSIGERPQPAAEAGRKNHRLHVRSSGK